MRPLKVQRSRDFQAADLLRVSEEIVARHGLHHIPQAVTELVLLEVDPTRLHVYWHIEHGDLFRARTAAGDPCASLVLRVLPRDHASEVAASAARELPVKGLTGSRYLGTPRPGAACYAEIGLRLRDGSIQPVVQSNLAHPPPQEESADYELIPVDTRIRPESQPADAGLGATMSGPVPDAPGKGVHLGSSWS